MEMLVDYNAQRMEVIAIDQNDHINEDATLYNNDDHDIIAEVPEIGR